MSKTKFLKTLEQCPTTHIKHVKKDYAYICDGEFKYYLDLRDYPNSINISTYENADGAGFKCIYYKRCPVDQFNWNVEKSRALLSNTFNIHF